MDIEKRLEFNKYQSYKCHELVHQKSARYEESGILHISIKSSNTLFRGKKNPPKNLNLHPSEEIMKVSMSPYLKGLQIGPF